MATYASITEDEFRDAVARARAMRPDVPLGTYIMVAAGDEPRVKELKAALGSNFFSRFVGEAGSVAQALVDLEVCGVDRVQLTSFTPGTLGNLLANLRASQA
jgi:hypothetical protein